MVGSRLQRRRGPRLRASGRHRARALQAPPAAPTDVGPVRQPAASREGVQSSPRRPSLTNLCGSSSLLQIPSWTSVRRPCTAGGSGQPSQRGSRWPRHRVARSIQVRLLQGRVVEPTRLPQKVATHCFALASVRRPCAQMTVRRAYRQTLMWTPGGRLASRSRAGSHGQGVVIGCHGGIPFVDNGMTLHRRQ